MKGALHFVLVVAFGILAPGPSLAQTAGGPTVSTESADGIKPVIRIWPGKAPGSEEWNYTETVRGGGGARGRVYSNVIDPTLTVYLPDPAKANGAAVIICPGGAMRQVNISDHDPTAEWLNSRGIGAFILKYRLVPDTVGAGGGPPRGADRSGGGGRAAARGGARGMPFGGGAELTFRDILGRNGNASPNPDNAEVAKITRLAIDDGHQSIRVLRRDAERYKLNPAKIGIMGFSAGGGVAVGTAVHESADGYPNFVATIFGPSLTEVTVPAEGAPLFIAVMDGHFNVTNGCLVLAALWKEAGRPVEMHLYDHASGPGSGMPKENYTDRLHEWLLARNIVTK